MTSITKLSELPQIERDKLRASLDELKRNIESTIEFEQLRSRIRGEKMKSLLSVGFSRPEALNIIMSDK